MSLSETGNCSIAGLLCEGHLRLSQSTGRSIEQLFVEVDEHQACFVEPVVRECNQVL